MTMPMNDGAGSTYTSARFWKCALQVNSEGYSKQYRGKDHGLTGEAFLSALLAECTAENIALIGLADHGSVSDVDAIRSYLQPHGIVVLPGFEICTTEKVHWVCLFSENTTIESLTRYLGALGLHNPADGVRPSNLGGARLLEEVEKLGGFCYAAHVTNDSGILKGKFSQLWQDPRLLAAQIPGDAKDLRQNFLQIAANTDPAYRRERPIALINAKDVAEPSDLRDSRASSLVKMTKPGFDALCMAFKDPTSRIKLGADSDASTYSRISRLRIDGGYLGGLNVEFSPHLNAIIGGRGTGKSTLIECIRYALGLEHKTTEAKKQGDSIIKENIGKGHGRIEVEVTSAHQQLLTYRVVRRYGEPIRIIDPAGNDSALTVRDILPGIEIYGQNEIYEVARDRDALIHVLNRSLPDPRMHEQNLSALQRRLKSNGEKLDTAAQQREELEAQLQKLPGLEEQVKQFDAIGLAERLKLVPLLARERQFPGRMQEEIDQLVSGLASLRDSLPDTAFLSEKAIEDLPHAAVLRAGRATLDKLTELLRTQLTPADDALSNASTELTSVIAELERERLAAEDAMEKQFATLPSMAGKDGSAVGRTYQSLQRQIEEITPLRARVLTAGDLVKSLEQDRRNLLGELSDLRNSRTRALEAEVKRLNKKLAGKLKLRVEPSANRRRLREFLAQLPGIGDKSLEWVDKAADLTIPALVEACRAGPAAVMAKQWGVTQARAETICKLARAELLLLETIDLDDRVVLELNVAHEGESFRPLERLSTGQQCTAILHLLLLDNPDPLVMDQPEDNLDNAFIADRIVQELRSAKTKRQFIFATHNANIPVFGDAEWIGVFVATQEQGSIPAENQGSVDVPHIRDEAARILDGGREAFLQRQQKYGY